MAWSMTRRGLVVVLALLCCVIAAPRDTAAQQAQRECTTLTCAKCTSICNATCDAEAKTCNASGARGCPAKFRSCARNCPSLLCAQCMPVQYGDAGRKFLPGNTELCRTPGRFEDGKK